MLTYDEYREAAATIAQDAVRGVDPEVIREHLSDSGRSFGPADVAAVRSLLSTASMAVSWPGVVPTGDATPGELPPVPDDCYPPDAVPLPVAVDVDQLTANVAHALIVGDSDERTASVRDLLEGWYAAWPETAVVDEHEPLAGLLVRLFDGRLARVERERDEARAELADLERVRDKAIVWAQSTERADIARQIKMLASDERLLVDWASTCDPVPMTVAGFLVALAGKLTAGDAPPALEDAAADEPAPQSIPAAWELVLLRQAEREEGLDVADDELLDHHRTATYRSVIQAAYRVGFAVALGYEIEVGDLGDRLLVGDRVTPAEPERPVDRVAQACGDPGSITPRREGESLSLWTARAVVAVLDGWLAADRCPGSRS
jgi:hypothetical protein